MREAARGCQANTWCPCINKATLFHLSSLSTNFLIDSTLTMWLLSKFHSSTTTLLENQFIPISFIDLNLGPTISGSILAHYYVKYYDLCEESDKTFNKKYDLVLAANTVPRKPLATIIAITGCFTVFFSRNLLRWLPINLKYQLFTAFLIFPR